MDEFVYYDHQWFSIDPEDTCREEDGISEQPGIVNLPAEGEERHRAFTDKMTVNIDKPMKPTYSIVYTA